MIENIQLVPHEFEPFDIVSVDNEHRIRSFTSSVIIQKYCKSSKYISYSNTGKQSDFKIHVYYKQVLYVPFVTSSH